MEKKTRRGIMDFCDMFLFFFFFLTGLSWFGLLQSAVYDGCCLLRL